MVKESALPPDIVCWVSPAKVLCAQWRCWITGDNIADICQIRKGAEFVRTPGAPDEVMAFAVQRAAGWRPYSCVVLDIAETAEGLWMVDFTPIHTATWGGADVPKVLQGWLDCVIREIR